MSYCEVLIEHEALSLNRTFTYYSEKALRRGIRVRVPFANRMLTGLVLSCSEQKPDCDYEIKTIKDTVDEKPLLNDELFELAGYIADQSISSLMSVIKTMLPAAYKPSSGLKERFLKPG